jgi:hypothetical protein
VFIFLLYTNVRGHVRGVCCGGKVYLVLGPAAGSAPHHPEPHPTVSDGVMV